MIYFTADHHFGHENIIKYVNRKFTSVGQMDSAMVETWNEHITDEDEVYHLGDFTLAGADYALKILSRLNGSIKIVPGGHDKKWLRMLGFNIQKGDTGTFEREHPHHPEVEVLPMLTFRKFEGEQFTLCHYPMRSWEQSHYGRHHLHGHCHGTIGCVGLSTDRNLPPQQKVGARIDVGVDCWDFMPLRLQDCARIARAHNRNTHREATDED